MTNPRLHRFAALSALLVVSGCYPMKTERYKLTAYYTADGHPRSATSRIELRERDVDGLMWGANGFHVVMSGQALPLNDDPARPVILSLRVGPYGGQTIERAILSAKSSSAETHHGRAGDYRFERGTVAATSFPIVFASNSPDPCDLRPTSPSDLAARFGIRISRIDVEPTSDPPGNQFEKTFPAMISTIKSAKCEDPRLPMDQRPSIPDFFGQELNIQP